MESELSTVDALAQLSFLIQGTLDRHASARDLSMIQLRLLGVLRDREPTLGQLGRLLGLDKSSTSGLVDRAERRGLVQRRASASDGRAVLVSLTQSGRELVSDAAEAFGAEVTELVAVLPVSERERLTKLAARVLEADAERRGTLL